MESFRKTIVYTLQKGERFLPDHSFYYEKREQVVPGVCVCKKKNSLIIITPEQERGPFERVHIQQASDLKGAEITVKKSGVIEKIHFGINGDESETRHPLDGSAAGEYIDYLRHGEPKVSPGFRIIKKNGQKTRYQTWGSIIYMTIGKQFYGPCKDIRPGSYYKPLWAFWLQKLNKESHQPGQYKLSVWEWLCSWFPVFWKWYLVVQDKHYGPFTHTLQFTIFHRQGLGWVAGVEKHFKCYILENGQKQWGPFENVLPLYPLFARADARTREGGWIAGVKRRDGWYILFSYGQEYGPFRSLDLHAPVGPNLDQWVAAVERNDGTWALLINGEREMGNTKEPIKIHLFDYLSVDELLNDLCGTYRHEKTEIPEDHLAHLTTWIAVVQDQGLWYIVKNGEIIFGPYREPIRFDHELGMDSDHFQWNAYVKQEDGWYFIQNEGKDIRGPFASPEANSAKAKAVVRGLTSIRKSTGWYLIWDKTGVEQGPFGYNDLKVIHAHAETGFWAAVGINTAQMDSEVFLICSDGKTYGPYFHVMDTMHYNPETGDYFFFADKECDELSCVHRDGTEQQAIGDEGAVINFDFLEEPQTGPNGNWLIYYNGETQWNEPLWDPEKGVDPKEYEKWDDAENFFVVNGAKQLGRLYQCREVKQGGESLLTWFALEGQQVVHYTMNL
jgi:hypothetical protein